MIVRYLCTSGGGEDLLGQERGSPGQEEVGRQTGAARERHDARRGQERLRGHLHSQVLQHQQPVGQPGEAAGEIVQK